jgi:hypothetical protein
MTMDTAFQAQLGAILLLVVVSLLLIALQVDALHAYKRKFALWSMAVFLAGAGAIWYLEEIKSYFWEKQSVTRQARSGHEGAGWEGGGNGRRGGGRGREGSGQDEANAGLGADGEDASRVRYPQFVRKNRFQECPDCPEMVIIPAGDDGAPIPHFGLGRFEVSIAEFHKFVVHSGYAPSRECEGMATADNVPAYLQLGLRHAGGRPVACVSWQDARAYTAWLSAKTGQTYRLPSAREWAHAARGGAAPVASVSGGRFPVQKISLQGGNDAAVSLAQLNIPASSSNGYGVFDMAGGVAEWVHSCAEGATAIVLGGASRNAETLRGCARQALGGSWADGEGIDRVRVPAFGAASASIGLRVARDLPKSE